LSSSSSTVVVLPAKLAEKNRRKKRKESSESTTTDDFDPSPKRRKLSFAETTPSLSSCSDSSSDESDEDGMAVEATQQNMAGTAIGLPFYKTLTLLYSSVAADDIVASHLAYNIYRSDLRRLNPYRMLDDSLVCFYLSRYLDKLPPDIKRRIYVMDSQLFQKVTDDGKLVYNRTKENLDRIFTSEVFLIPVCKEYVSC
jgi:hypothetical protein